MRDDAPFERRHKILEIVEQSRRGHIGSAFSIVEMLMALYDSMHYDPRHPDDPGRDRFILSKGHGCLALYVEMAERGFFPRGELAKFCASDGILGGHPEHGLVPGVEVSTGSLGHGLSIGVGMALAGKMDNLGHRVFVLISDGECDEGSVWEAALCAAKHGLDNLAVLLDYNKMQCYSTTSEVLELEPLKRKWESFGFAVREAPGHDAPRIKTELAALPYGQAKPSLLVCHTIKGKGIPELEQNPRWHHKAKVTDEEMRLLWQGLEAGRKGAP